MELFSENFKNTVSEEDKALLLQSVKKEKVEEGDAVDVKFKSKMFEDLALMCQDLDRRLSNLENKYGDQKIFDNPRTVKNHHDQDNNGDISPFYPEVQIKAEPENDQDQVGDYANLYNSGQENHLDSMNVSMTSSNESSENSSVKSEDFLGVHFLDRTPTTPAAPKREKSTSPKKEENGWTDSDSTVPVGWKTKEFLNATGQKVKHFLSPSGQFLPGRNSAIRYMEQDGGFPIEEIEHMKRPLKAPIWNEDDKTVPYGWKTRMGKINSKAGPVPLQFFLSPDGQIFKGRKAALRFIEESKIGTNEDLRKMKSVPMKKYKSKYEWNDNDPTVPGGWKTTSVTLNTFGRTMQTKRYQAPDGKFCFTRVEALRYMFKEGIFPKNDIEKMKRPLLDEGWVTDKNLPNGWMLKADSKSDVNNPFQVSFQYVSHDFTHFKSTRKVKEFMENDSRYTTKDIEALKHGLNSESNKLRKDKYDWIDGDETIPDGWKKRVVDCVNNKQKIFYLAPDGASFVCRRNALQHMIKQNYSKKDIELMRDNLNHDGWKTSQLLPVNWRMKEVESSVKGVYSYDVKYLNDAGEMFASTKAVVEHMRKDGKYSVEDIEKLEEGFSKQNKKKCAQKYDWISGDQTLPAGWKIRHCLRKDGKNTSYFLSPGGESFVTRLQCLQYLIKENGNDIEEMRSKLEHESWFSDNSVLPAKWLMKKIESYQKDGQYQIDIRYLSPEGVLFKSTKAALAHMKKNGNYTKDDTEKIEAMVSEQSKESRYSRYDWNENDDTVPKGWKTRVFEGKKTKKFFLAPDGTQFACRRVGLQHMISKNNEEDEIEEMRDMLKHEGWEETDMLPHGWRVRKTEGSTKGVYNSECYFLSKKGQMFHSTKAVIEHMKGNEQYDEEDIAKIGMMLEDDMKKNRNEKYIWEEDPNLPEGWKFRSIMSKGVYKDYVLSPDGTQFSCRRLAIEFMKRENYHPDLVERALTTLIVEGWVPNERLPWGWRVKEFNKNTTFLSRDLEIFKSNKAALDYMSYNNYSDHEIDQFKLLTEDQQKWRRAENFNWETEEGLPEGWKTRSTKCSNKKIRVFLLAPDGSQITGRRQAIDYMLLEGYPVHDIDKMMKSLRKEGWVPDPSFLPDGWLKKKYVGKDKKLSYCYLSPANQRLQGLSSMLEYMENDGEYSEEDMDKIRVRINSYNRAKMENLKHNASQSSKANYSAFDESSISTAFDESSISMDNYEDDDVAYLEDENDEDQSRMDDYDDEDESFVNPLEILQQNCGISEDYDDEEEEDNDDDNDVVLITDEGEVPVNQKRKRSSSGTASNKTPKL